VLYNFLHYNKKKSAYGNYNLGRKRVRRLFGAFDLDNISQLPYLNVPMRPYVHRKVSAR